MGLAITTRKMIYVMCGLALLVLIAGVVYHGGNDSARILPYVLGIALGVGLNLAKIVMLEHAVQKAVSLESKAAKNAVSINYLLRFVLTGAVLAAAVFIPFIDLWGTIFGVLTMNLAVYALKFITK